MHSIFGTDGIRGRFGSEINFSLAYRVGYSLGSICKQNNPIVIGRDTRISGDVLVEGISRGISASGKEFINVGICPTPAIPLLIRKQHFSSGLMISASHNPPEYNGIKIFDKNGNKISKDCENTLQALIQKIDINKKYEKRDITPNTDVKLLNIYINNLINTMGGDNLDGLKIILDTCYGSATTCASNIFKSLGANVKTINNKKDGLKINVKCGSTHLDPLKKAIKENNADMGFSFDGDADRVIGVDSKGNILDGDHILFLWGRELLEQELLTNKLLISTQMANLGFENKWRDIGGGLHRTEVGDKFIFEAIKERKAVLGGEQSGHILSNINNFSGDGILTAIQIARFCKKKKISLSDWLKSSFSPLPQKLTNINLNFDIRNINKKNKKLLDEIIKDFTVNSFENYRVYIRPSGTEPLIRVLVEAKTFKRTNTLSKQITSKLNSEINKILN